MVASVIFSSWDISSSMPLSGFSAAASLTMLKAPHEEGGGGGGIGQVTHLLGFDSHNSGASVPRLRTFVMIGPFSRQPLHFPQSWALQKSHAPHRSLEWRPGSTGCRFGSGMAGLGLGSSRIFFLNCFPVSCGS